MKATAILIRYQPNVLAIQERIPQDTYSFEQVLTVINKAIVRPDKINYFTSITMLVSRILLIYYKK